MSEHRSCLDVYRDYCTELEEKYREATRLVSEREKEIIEIRGELHHSKKKNNSLQAELLNVKSEKAGINYFGTYDHIVLKEENVQLKAELDAVKHENSMFHGELLSARYEISALKQRVNMENVYKMQWDDLLKLSKQQDAEIEQLSKDRCEIERELIRTKANLAGEIKGQENCRALQSKIDRLKKGNQDLQAKLGGSEKREGELRADNNKYHIHNNSLFLMNEELRAALARHKDNNHTETKRLEKKNNDLEARLKQNREYINTVNRCTDAGKSASEAKNVQAMQSKIDRLKKNNQDLQAKLAQLELERAINKAPTPKFEPVKELIPYRFATSLEESLAYTNSKLAKQVEELKANNSKYRIHNTSLSLMNEDLRGAVAFHKEGNYEKIKNLEKENERLKKDMWALRQDNEHFSKCSDEFKGRLSVVAENFKFYYEHIHERFPFISVPPERFPELIKQILRGEDVCS